MLRYDREGDRERCEMTRNEKGRLGFGSLFAGIGGFDLGLERAGMVCQWQVEIDEYARRVLAKHWPDVPRHSDVRDCGGHNLERVEVIVGGFPCQPHSVAGKRGGVEDDRNLWPEYRRIVAELGPAWVVAENVVGIRTTILDQVLSDLENLDYATGTLDIPAGAFDCVHQRRRIFVVAHSESEGWAGVLRGDLDGFSQAKRCKREVSLDTQGSPFLQFEKGVGQPAVFGMDDGIPHRVDRLRCLGNAVVPHVAEFIGEAIVEVCQRG